MSPAETRAAPRRRKILVVVGSLDVGGVEMDILRNFPRLDRSRFDVTVYAFIEPGALAPQLERSGIAVVVPPKRLKRTPRPAAITPTRRSLLRRTLGQVRRTMVPAVYEWLPIDAALRRTAQARYVTKLAWPLSRYIRANRVDVVHTFLPHAYLVGAAARAVTPGVKLAMSRVSSNFYMTTQPQYRFAETRLAHHLLDAAVCNADTIRSELIAEGIAADRITVIRNGIDAAPFADAAGRRVEARRRFDVPADALVMTTVANLHPYKGHADLIEALALIAGRLPPSWVLLCAGRDVDGTRAGLEQLVSRLRLDGRIRFLGSVDDVPALLAASDLHVHPSREDAFPNSVLEAMASALPVIATRVGGVPELVEDGLGGMLVPAGNPAALGEAILAVVGEPVRRRQMGNANRLRIETTFSLDVSVAAYERLYDRLTTGR